MRDPRVVRGALVAGALLVVGLLLLLRRPPEVAPASAAGPPGVAASAPAAPAAPAARAPVRGASPPPGAAGPRAESAPLRLQPATREEDAALPAGAFEGRVVSSDTGEAVVGAELTFAASRGAASVRTGTDGGFRFLPDAPGAWQLASVVAEGFQPFGPEWGESPVHLSAAPGRRVRGLLFALSPELEVRVRVEAPDGTPVAGAHVRRLTNRAGESALFPAADTLVTDGQGEGRLQAQEGAWLEARHPAHAPVRARVTQAAAQTRRVMLRLGRREAAGVADGMGVLLAGRVVDGAGLPVAGALVAVDSAARAYPKVYGDGVEQGAVTDTEGRFRVEGLAPGTYDVTAGRAGLAPAHMVDVAAGREDLVLRLVEGVRLEGVVRDASGAPVPAYALVVQERVGPLQRRAYDERTVVDAEGRYAVPGLRPGHYALQVAAHGLAPAEVDLQVAEGTRGPVRADVTLTRGARLTGVVVQAGSGTPVAGARLALEGEEAGALPVSFDALSDAQGAFALEGLRPGRVSLVVSAKGHHTRILSGLSVREGAPTFERVELQALQEGETPQTELVGIGAELSAREDALVLGMVVPGGGAAEAGLAPGDRILRIDGAPVAELGFAEAVKRIRGTEGSRLLLGVRKAGADGVVDVPVTRRRMQL